jgi:hypothetical protein
MNTLYDVRCTVQEGKTPHALSTEVNQASAATALLQEATVMHETARATLRNAFSADDKV